MKNEKSVLLKCPFDGGFIQPKICFSCGNPAAGKKWQVTSMNRLKNRKFIINFPICDACAEAKNQYINILPVNIIAVFVVFLSIFSLLNPSSSLPQPLFYAGGAIWIAGVLAYVFWLNRKAKMQNSAEVKARVHDLQHAVIFEKIFLPRKQTIGEVLVRFHNQKFAREFKQLNKGREIQ